MLESLAQIARRQDGVFTRAQAIGAGYSEDAIDRLLARKEWVAVHRAVYRPSATPGSWRLRVRAALLRVGHHAVASHLLAAKIWQLEGVPAYSSLELTVPTGKPAPQVRGCDVHRAPLPDQDVTTYDGWPITTALRTIVDLAPLLQLQALVIAIEDALRRNLFTLHALELRGAAAQGNGKARLREAWSRVNPALRSGYERRLLDLLLAAQLPLPAVGYAVRRGSRVRVLDFAYPSLLLAIELDGRVEHSRNDRFVDDRERGNALALADWHVVHVTPWDIDNRPAYVVEQVRLAIRKREQDRLTSYPR